MACSCQKPSVMGKKKSSKISGMDTLLQDVLDTTLPGIGMVVAHEIKGLDFVKGMATNADGTPNEYYPWLVNGVGIAAGVGLPMLIQDREMKSYAKGIGAGIAAQCMYTLYLTEVKKLSQAAVNGWNTYAMAGEKTYALARAKMGLPSRPGQPGIPKMANKVSVSGL